MKLSSNARAHVYSNWIEIIVNNTATKEFFTVNEDTLVLRLKVETAILLSELIDNEVIDEIKGQL